MAHNVIVISTFGKLTKISYIYEMKKKVGRPSGSKYNIDNYIGKTINRWKVLSFSHLNNKGEQYWNVQCQCGTESKVRVYPLIKGVGKGCKKCRPQSTPLSLPEGWSSDILFSPYYYRAIEYGAISRKIEFSVSPEYLNTLFLQQKSKCALSGIELTFSKKFKSHDGSASLDRIDSTKGYIPGNVQWIHKTINAMKMNLDEVVFIYFCKKIAANSN